ncbi:MAG: FAD-dependent monooxygenase [Verrucomicrobiota bacterium]
MSPNITIVGGGLAGLSLAVALRNEGIEVELFEKRHYPFHRVCGEFISGVSEQVLIDLGIRDCFEGRAEVDSMVWFIKDRVVLEECLPKPALGISRYTLDQRLAELAKHLGADVHQGKAYREKDAQGTVWASGKSLDRKSVWVGLSAHFEDIGVDRLEMHCGSTGYLGLSPIENGRVNVTGLFRKQPRIKARGVDLMYAYLEANGSHILSRRLQEGFLVKGSFAAIAGFEFGSQPSRGFTLGDRSLLIPPLAGNGMSMALEAASGAVSSLRPYCEGVCSWEQAIALQKDFLRQSFQLRMNVATRLHPILLSSLGLKTLSFFAGTGLLPTRQLYQALR